MSGFSPRALRSFEVAREVFRLLAANKIAAAVIGSVALAVHGYVRATRDLDFGVAVAFKPLREMAQQLRGKGYEVDIGEPSLDDPLGGVVTISGPDFDPVQIVNLRPPGGEHEKLAREAIASARRIRELGLPVVDLPHLVALKLASGSRQDELDILELLRANPEASMEEVVAVCGKHRLKKRLEHVLAT